MVTATIPSWADSAPGPSSASSSITTVSKGKQKATGGGSWAGLGVSPALTRALTLRGFKIPTPIQRTTLPSTLSTPPRDVLGMARTGSGKTLAYIVPLLQRLSSRISPVSGPKAIILCPTRELASQILKVGKDLGRGLSKEGEGSGLKWTLIMGGDPLDAQFEALSSGPDVIIATPGRLLHLLVEMSYDLRSVEMVIYDEADRLFEMGFEVQLHEILHRLPSNRQNLLFSATLPSAVAEFAKAGLTNPLLHRLDAEQKISEDLQLCFFQVKSDTKDAALLAVLESVLAIPVNYTEKTTNQAIIFVSTKHHVEYLQPLLLAAGYRANHIYGSLDQVARQQQLTGFRNGYADVLVVTDVAARGIDIPIMDNVINFDFPAGVKNFVHRVGRTARAGRKGTAWSFVTREDMPYLIELETFLRLEISSSGSDCFWSIPQTALDQKVEVVAGLDELSQDLPTLRAVMHRGRAMYERSRPKAASRSHKQAKETRGSAEVLPRHPSFAAYGSSSTVQQLDLLAKINAFTPSETVLEMGHRGHGGNADLMTARRKLVANRVTKAARSEPTGLEQGPLQTRNLTRPAAVYRDETHYIDHTRSNAVDDEGYSMKNPNFVEQLGQVTYDMTQDEGAAARANRPSQLKWDRKKKRMVKDEVGSDNKKLIRSESGALLPASYKSGRYDEWRKGKRGAKPGGHVSEAGARGDDFNDSTKGKPNRKSTAPATSRNRSSASSSARSELKSTSQMMRARQVAAKKQSKNGRGSSSRKPGRRT